MSRENLKNLKPKHKPMVKSKKVNTQDHELGKKAKIKVLLYTWVAVLSPLLIVALMLLTTFESDLPSIEALENPRSDESTNLYDANGKMIGTFFAMHTNRTKVSYQELPKHLINALKSTEDKRFETHSGVDGHGLMRAILGAMIGSNKGGASTITQQLAKMMFHNPAKSSFKRIRQKFAEWIIASRLETRYTKNEIIAMYFNEFDFTNNAVGIHSAARIYFGKEPKDLKIEECAVLVGMAKNPNVYNPKSKPDNALKRRNVVLYLMKEQEHITQEEYDSLKTLPIGLNFKKETYNSGVAPYLRAFVKKETRNIIKENNLLNEYGKPFDVERDGLKIYTTIDIQMQKYAENAVEEYIGKSLQASFSKNVIKTSKNYPYGNEVSKAKVEKKLQKAIESSSRYKQMKKGGKSEKEIKKVFNTVRNMQVFNWTHKNYRKSVKLSPLDSIKYYKQLLRVGMVSIDPKTGFVKAWVGGPNYESFKYDNVYQSRRQVGSTIKPFVYTAAIEASNAGGSGNLSACSTYPDVKYCVEVPNGSASKLWCPGGQKTYSGVATPLYFALANSMNNITAKLTENPNVIPSVNKYFETMGLKNNSFSETPSLALGVCDMSVMDITSAHTIFSNNGAYIKPVVIARIEDKHGKVIYESNMEIKQVVDENTAFEVLRMMKGVAGVYRPADKKLGGTARRIRGSSRSYKFAGIMAGKTGTTQNNADGWFIGHTPDLVTGVWVGCEEPSIHFSVDREGGSLGQGANTALPIWGYYMKWIYRNKTLKINKGDFAPPKNQTKTTIKCDNVGSDVYNPLSL